MSTAASVVTFEEFERLPYPEAGKMELVNGEVVIAPPPVFDHSTLRDRIMLFLSARLGLDERRIHGDHTGYRVGPGWFEPDVSISWPNQRRDDKYLIGSPMVAVEILSPGEVWSGKLDLYARNGAKEVWIIDYQERTFLVFEVEQDKIIFHMVSESWTSAAGLTITLADVFGEK